MVTHHHMGSQLRSAIAADETSKGWNCNVDDVYVCHGVTEALQIIFAATLEEGSKVLAPGPHYPPYMAYPQMYGAKTIEYALKSDDGWGIDLDDIESKMDSDVRLLVLINPNNPTGNVAGLMKSTNCYPSQKMAKLYDCCR